MFRPYAGDGRLGFEAIGEDDLHALGAEHDVKIGQDRAFVDDNDTGADAFFDVFAVLVRFHSSHANDRRLNRLNAFAAGDGRVPFSRVCSTAPSMSCWVIWRGEGVIQALVKPPAAKAARRSRPTWAVHSAGRNFASASRVLVVGLARSHFRAADRISERVRSVVGVAGVAVRRTAGAIKRYSSHVRPFWSNRRGASANPLQETRRLTFLFIAGSNHMKAPLCEVPKNSCR